MAITVESARESRSRKGGEHTTTVFEFKLPLEDWQRFQRVAIDIKDTYGSTPVMNFGPSLCDIKTAVNDGWINSEDDFVPHLEVAGDKEMSINILNHTLDTLNVMIPTAGYGSKEWYGGLRLGHSGDDLLIQPNLSVELYSGNKVKIQLSPELTTEGLTDAEIATQLLESFEQLI